MNQQTGQKTLPKGLYMLNIGQFGKGATKKSHSAGICHSKIQEQFTPWGNSEPFSKASNRKAKYNFLGTKSLYDIDWSKLEIEEPHNFFVPKNFKSGNEFENWISVSELFNQSSLGIEFGSKDQLTSIGKDQIEDFVSNIILNDKISTNEIEDKYGIKTTSGWKFQSLRKEALREGYKSNLVKKSLSSPFNIKYTYHSHILRRPQIDVLKNMHLKNLALITVRQTRASELGCFFITNSIYSKDVISIVDRATGFPLYVYSADNNQQTLDEASNRHPNLNPKIVKKIAAGLGLTFTPEKEETEGTFAPIDLLDYIYAVLHSPTYRETYKEFLKIDFPRVPYPEDKEQFWKLVKLGGELRRVHLMEHEVVSSFITTYPKAGSNVVERKLTKTSPGWEPNVGKEPGEPKQSDSEHRYPGEQLGRVWINDTQYFGNVPLKAWEFYIGGYQPAQKWLKDRRGRVLTMEDVQHYQKIVVALMETGRVMGVVDGVIS